MIPYSNFNFSYQHTEVDSARIGLLDTPHGLFETPNFIFCATKASIKGLAGYQVKEAGADIILSNTYHLMINPGSVHIQKLGGLHKFMNWNGPMLTDSGGYQIFAMGHGSVSSEIKKGQGRILPKSLLKISEDGVLFKSYLDGKKIYLSPEITTCTQQQLGADLFMQFDECTPFHVDKHYTHKAMQRSLRWGDRCIEEFKKQDNCTQAMYGIIQGGIYEDIRKESVLMVESQNFWGTAIGGSLGSDRNQMHDVIAMTASLLNKKRAIHLLGIGDIPDIFWGVRQGIDTFDCVHPTRIARHACAIVPARINKAKKLNLKNSQYALEDIPIDALCTQPCCRQYSRAYIHYLVKAKELLAIQLLSMHNVAQIARLMKEIQHALKESQITHNSRSYDALEKFWLEG